MKYVVTGHLGFIGGLLLKRLLEDGKDAVGYDIKEHPELGYSPLTAMDFDVVYHLGAISGIEACEAAPESAVNYNVLSSVAWAVAASARNARMVFASSMAAAHPTGIYGVTKSSAEQLLRAYSSTVGSDITILRLSNVYGPGSILKNSVVAKMFKDSMREGTIYTHGPSSLQRRDFVYVDDVVEAFLQDHPADTYSVGTGKYTTIRQLAKKISSYTGAKIEHEIGKSSGSIYPTDSCTPRLDLPAVGYTSIDEGLAHTADYFTHLEAMAKACRLDLEQPVA